MTIPTLLLARLQTALAGFDQIPPDFIPHVTATADARFGDYQTNAAMLLAKPLRQNPRQIAEKILAALACEDLCETVEIAGAGFINFRLRPAWLSTRFSELLGDARLGVPVLEKPKTIIFDFSSPNVAKPMHVGHIRSTILGDALSRIALFLGHRVIRDNHIGDWGTQFGMLLFGWKTQLDRVALAADPLSEMERLYKLVSASSKNDPQVLAQVHAELVKLQDGDAENLQLWQEMIRLSQAQFDAIYGRLGVHFDVVLGESFYNPQLRPIVEELRERKIATESAGAWCIFPDGSFAPEDDPFMIKDQDGWRPNPAIIQKSDGAANYATTDLATLAYREKTWQPDEIVYVTDGRQQLHFRQIFSAYRRWHPETRMRLVHAWFGKILGDDGKPFKTRSGENIRLSELLDEAETRAGKIVAEKNPELPESERQEIARQIGLGAVKYADLLPNRQSDYAFSWDKMLSLQGNTAPYLQNAYVRTRSILRKAEGAGSNPVSGVVLELQEPAELALAKKNLQFGEVLPLVLDDFRPNLLANYLFELASLFHTFFEACPVLKAEGATRTTRLALCTATGRTLQQGLALLGIETPKRM